MEPSSSSNTSGLGEQPAGSVATAEAQPVPIPAIPVAPVAAQAPASPNVGTSQIGAQVVVPTATTGQVSGASGPTPEIQAKLHKRAMWFGIGSLIIFVIGFILGFAALLGIALGIYAIRMAKQAKYKGGVVLGWIGIALNVILLLMVAAFNAQH